VAICAVIWAAGAKIGAVGVKGGHASQIRVFHTPNYMGYACSDIRLDPYGQHTGETGLFLRIRITEYTYPYAIWIRLDAFLTLVMAELWGSPFGCHVLAKASPMFLS
jgi:hypothetical protein